MWIIFYPNPSGRPEYQKYDYGYSKPLHQEENPRKSTMQILQEAIIRVCINHRSKYLRPGMRIEYYRCFSHDNKDNVHLFTILPDRVLPEPLMVGQPDMMAFLNKLHDSPLKQYGTELFPTHVPSEAPRPTPSPSTVFPDVHQQGGPKDPFDETRYFRTDEHLWAYIQQLLHDGHPNGRVEHYYRIMARKRR